MNTKSPARFYEALHIYEHVQRTRRQRRRQQRRWCDGRREGSLRSETFIIHAVRDHRFELIRRRSFAGKIKIILYINLISLYGRSILCQWQIFQWALQIRAQHKKYMNRYKKVLFTGNNIVVSLTKLILINCLMNCHKNIALIF